MNRNFFFTVLFLSAVPLFAQRVVSFDELEVRLKTESDTVYLVNFWATWCAPCVAELPYFEELREKYHHQPFKVLLVSLDYKSQVAKRVSPFIQANHIQSEVVVLSEKDPNRWLPKVSEEWTGALPATLVFDKSRRLFLEQSFESLRDLELVLQPFFAP
jgi:thiol-disulfide isomerase/thioredoxin